MWLLCSNCTLPWKIRKVAVYLCSFCNRRQFASLTHWFAKEIFSFDEEIFLDKLSSLNSLCFGLDNGLKWYIFQSLARYFLWANWKKNYSRKSLTVVSLFFFFYFKKTNIIYFKLFTIKFHKVFIITQVMKWQYINNINKLIVAQIIFDSVTLLNFLAKNHYRK